VLLRQSKDDGEDTIRGSLGSSLKRRVLNELFVATTDKRRQKSRKKLILWRTVGSLAIDNCIDYNRDLSTFWNLNRIS
jgi:hypothetical protein